MSDYINYCVFLKTTEVIRPGDFITINDNGDQLEVLRITHVQLLKDGRVFLKVRGKQFFKGPIT